MERAAIISPYFRLPVKNPGQSGWMAAAELFSGDDKLLRDMVITHGREAWGTSNPHVAGSAFIIAYLTRLVWPVIGQYVLARRVPEVPLENLAFHLNSGRIDATAMIEPTFFLLPDDPAAGHADGSTLGDENALFHRLKQSLFDDNLARVVTALTRSANASVNVSRNAVASACAQAFHFLYPEADNPDLVTMTAAALFNDPGSLVHGQLTMEEFGHRGKQGFFARRRGCCLAWRIEKDQRYCSNCILVPAAQQDRIFRAMLEQPGPYRERPHQ